jgi:hypothetical protein
MVILLGKMRITVRSKKLVELSRNHLSFYKKYAVVVFNTLRKPLFQKFLSWMLRREEIKENKVKDVQIRMFPFKKENGNGLAGKCNSEGKILLYPKKLEFCRNQMQEFGKENLSLYIKNRARAALIHELLHLKYVSDEERVRELTKRYFNILARHQPRENSNSHKIAKMLFTQ